MQSAQNLLYCNVHCEGASAGLFSVFQFSGSGVSCVREGDAPEIKHVTHGEGMAGEGVDDESA